MDMDVHTLLKHMFIRDPSQWARMDDCVTFVGFVCYRGKIRNSLCLSLCLPFVSLFFCNGGGDAHSKKLFFVHILTDVVFFFSFSLLLLLLLLLLPSSFLFIEKNRVGLQSWLSLLFSFVNMHLK